MATKTPFANTACAVRFMAYTLYLAYLGLTATGSVSITIGFLVVVWIFL